tara:strand:+ start:4514 stop:5758 length:1245 start_codon:yes stop_codon:yes gene_type:complete
MKITKNKIILFYFFLYISLIVGFYFNEDFAGGFKDDYNLHHWLIKNLFSDGILYGLLNYDIYYVPHSPLFVIYIVYLEKIFIHHELYKFFNLHLSLILPVIIGFSLKYKYNLKKLDPKFLIPSIIFISPYFRAGSIWIDDNIFSLIFLSFSILFFIKFENSKDKINNILLCTLFLALASYFRPIYSIFSIYFFLNFFNNFKSTKKLSLYIALNIILASPAFYYVFVLNINKWAQSYLFRENIITVLSLVSSVMMFYFLPFILKDYRYFKEKIFNLKSVYFVLTTIVLLFFFFDYNRGYSGGVFLKISKLFFNNHYFYYILSAILVLIFYHLFFNEKKKINNLDIILIITLFILEIDGVIYHETYDPLLIILISLLFKNKIISTFIKNFNYKNFIFVFSYFFIFYLMAVAKTLIL